MVDSGREKARRISGSPMGSAWRTFHNSAPAPKKMMTMPTAAQADRSRRIEGRMAPSAANIKGIKEPGIAPWLARIEPLTRPAATQKRGRLMRRASAVVRP